MRKSRRGWAELAVGLLLLCAACGLWLENSRSDRHAAAASQQLLAQVWQQIETGQQTGSAARLPPQNEAPLPPPVSGSSEEDLNTSGILDAFDNSNVLGVLEIPALSLTLPVWAAYGEELLKQAPCRYEPPGEAPPPFVICGHNYRSQFGGLHRLGVGDRVNFTDLEGRVQRYTVAETAAVPQDDVAALETEDWDLTLFTCTPSRVSRVLVRCQRD
ncbi:MAG: sortase [Oscillospiraceae bacterium]